MDNLLPAEDFRLYAVTTHHPHKLGKEIKLEEVRKGFFEVRWGIRRIRIVVLNRIEEEKRNAIWTLFSSSQDKFKHGAVHYHWRRKTASTIINQLYAFYQSEGIAMPYTMDDYVRDTRREMLESVTVEEMLKMFSIDEILKKCSPEERMKGLPPEEFLKGLPPEERMKGLPPEEFLKGLPPKERLKGLSVEEIKAWLSKLEKKPGNGSQ
ncbi:MAG: hypothetical protein GY862_06295 [Gammaproteobacteria bacterium]|nr:hypothetical protein [Gammaproteobacteria bacterium]